MHVTCDLIVELPDKRCFEWNVFVHAKSLSAAADWAERHVANWNAMARIEEMNLQSLPADRDAEEAAASGTREGVYSSFGPREVVRHQSSFGRVSQWLKGE